MIFGSTAVPADERTVVPPVGVNARARRTRTAPRMRSRRVVALGTQASVRVVAVVNTPRALQAMRPGREGPEGLVEAATTAMPAPVVVTGTRMTPDDTRGRPTVAVAGARGMGATAKVAVTERVAFIATVQVPVPVQSPLQPVKADPLDAVAVSVTGVP